jgi:LCP family protein required for cell wall assembly
MLLSGRKRLIAAGAALLLLVGLGAVILVTYYQLKDPGKILLDGRPAFGMNVNIRDEFPRDIVNIAFLGFDRDQFREEYAYLFLSDVIILLSIDFAEETVKLVYVPRDAYVPIYNSRAKDKASHAYYYGYHYGEGDPDEAGLFYVLETVSHLLGDIPIHYYVSICMDGVVQLVDAMGGVHFELEERLYDHAGNVLFWEGPQQLDGMGFLMYVRYRDPATGQDLGRIERQKDLLMAAFQYFKSHDRFRAIPDTYRFYKEHVDTNLSYKQIVALALYARNFAANEQTVKFYTLPGTAQMSDGISYLSLDQSERVRLIKEIFGINATLWPTDILRDTPPAQPVQFQYELQEGGGESPAVLIYWVPGDNKKVYYRLYRWSDEEKEERLLTGEQFTETSYLDLDLDFDRTYYYRLEITHYSASSQPVILIVHIPLPEE